MAGTLTPPTSSSIPIQNPISTTPEARAFFGRLYDGARSGLSQRRPWMELADRNQFAKPNSVAESTTRIRKNWTYFRINYIILLSLVLVVSLVSHPVSLFVLVLLLSGWLFLYVFRSEPLVLFNRSYSDREVLGILLLLTIVVIFLTSVGSLIISTLMVGLAIVCTHAAFRVPEDLFLDEQEAGGGLFSILGNVPTAASVVAGRV